jgi:hypothetical protein
MIWYDPNTTQYTSMAYTVQNVLLGSQCHDDIIRKSTDFVCENDNKWYNLYLKFLGPGSLELETLRLISKK